MLQGIIIKKVLDLVLKQLLKQFKLDKIQKYVEEPNELDLQVKVLQKKVNKYAKVIEDVEKTLALLDKDSHPPIFGEKDKKNIIKRIKKLEKEK